MTTPSVSARRKHYVAKEPAIGSLVDQNSEVGLIRQIQSIFGAMGFVSYSIIECGCHFAKNHTDFCLFKAGCGKTILMYESG
jgi:hypothetical protein